MSSATTTEELSCPAANSSSPKTLATTPARGQSPRRNGFFNMEQTPKVIAGIAFALALVASAVLAVLDWRFQLHLEKKAPATVALSAVSSTPGVRQPASASDGTTPSWSMPLADPKDRPDGRGGFISSAAGSSETLAKTSAEAFATVHRSTKSQPIQAGNSVYAPSSAEKNRQPAFPTGGGLHQVASVVSGADWGTPVDSKPIPAAGSAVDASAQARLQLPASLTVENHEVEITSDTQVAEWERLQDEFIAAVDGKAPSDSASRSEWIQAQRRNDELFRAKFGTEAFLRQQMDAYRAGIQRM